MKRFIVLLLALCLLLCACGKADTETTPDIPEDSTPSVQDNTGNDDDDTQDDTQDDVQDDIQDEVPPVDVDPLTGEALDEVFEGRPFAIMINNAQVALPHGGVAEAGVLYEALVEGWGTRMMAIFSDPSQAGPIGSVRSCRPPFIDVVQGYDAIYSSVSGDESVLKLIYNNGVDYLNAIYDTTYYYRDTWRMNNMGYEHSMMIDGADLTSLATDNGLRTTRETEEFGFRFDDSVALNGESAESVTIYFRAGGKTTSAIYDESTGMYYLRQYGIDYTDANTQEKVPFRNIFVLQCNTYTLANGVHVQSETVGEGTGYYLRDGQMVSIRWSRADVDSPFVYTLEDGSELTMGVGTSYIALIGLDGYVNVN